MPYQVALKPMPYPMASSLPFLLSRPVLVASTLSYWPVSATVQSPDPVSKLSTSRPARMPWLELSASPLLSEGWNFSCSAVNHTQAFSPSRGAAAFTPKAWFCRVAGENAFAREDTERDLDARRLRLRMNRPGAFAKPDSRIDGVASMMEPVSVTPPPLLAPPSLNVPVGLSKRSFR